MSLGDMPISTQRCSKVARSSSLQWMHTERASQQQEDMGRDQLKLFIPLGSANQLANLGNKDIHRSDGLLVVVQLHVERFDALGVVNHYGRLLENLMERH